MSELWQHAFFRHAILACILGGGGLSLIGVFVTLMDIPFLGISMSHSAFLGAVIGLLCGFDPLLGAMLACAVTGILVGPLSDRAGASSNSMLAVIFSATMGLAFLLLNRIPGPKSEALALIWGSILTISAREIAMLAVIFSIAALLLLAFFKELSAVLFNREVAAAVGIPERLFYYGVILLAGLLISASLNIVGGLLIFSLLVNPPGAAYQLTYRLKTMFILSAVFGMASCFAGLYVSYRFDVPTGAVIVLCSSAIYALAFAASPKRRSGRLTRTIHTLRSSMKLNHTVQEEREEYGTDGAATPPLDTRPAAHAACPADTRRRAFFNERAEQWLDMWYKNEEAGNYSKFDSEFGRLFALAALRPGQAVLDLGCGSGVMVPYILDRIGPAGRLQEVDYAERMIEVNRRLHDDPRVTFTVASVDELDVPEAGFDTVFCFSCFPHFHRKAETLGVIHKALKPGGTVVVAHFNSSQEINDHHRKHACVMHDHLPDETHMRNLLCDAGFAIGRFIDEPGFYYVDARKHAQA